MFDFKTEKAAKLFSDLVLSSDGTEPCYDPNLLDKDNAHDSVTDMYVENHTNRGMDPKVAEELCEGCKVKELCLAFALENDEREFVWGGTTPAVRKEMKNGK